MVAAIQKLNLLNKFVKMPISDHVKSKIYTIGHIFGIVSTLLLQACKNEQSNSGSIGSILKSTFQTAPRDFEMFGIRTDISLSDLKSKFPAAKCKETKTEPPCDSEFAPRAYTGEYAGTMIACIIDGPPRGDAVSINIVECSFTPDPDIDAPVSIVFLSEKLESISRAYKSEKYTPSYEDSVRLFKQRTGINPESFKSTTDEGKMLHRDFVRDVAEFRFGPDSLLQLVSGDDWRFNKHLLQEVYYRKGNLRPEFRKKIKALMEEAQRKETENRKKGVL